MNRRPWVKLWADCLDSRQLAKAGEAAEVLFYRLLVLNGKEGRGDTLALSAEDIAWRMRLSVEDVERRLAALTAAGLIELGDGIAFPGWAERQAEKSEAERKAALRARKRDVSRDCPETVPGQVRDMSRDCPVLESESESEEEYPPTQPSVVQSESAGTVPAAAVGVGPASPPMPPAGPRIARRTDADLQPWFDAVCRGLGQSLTWGPRYVMPAERIVAHAQKHGLGPPDVERIAAHYRAKCREGTPSFPRFADDIDRWRADWLAANPGRKPKPKPADLRAAGRCPNHPGETLRPDGNCDLCESVADFIAREATA